MYRYVALGLITLLLGFGAGWKTQGWRLGKEIFRLQKVKAQEEIQAQNVALEKEKQYRQIEKNYQSELAKSQEKRNVQVADINRKLNDALVQLRNRPERIVAASNSEVSSTPATCVGSSGAELARGDAEFLAGYAADAAKLDAELTKCQAAYDSLMSPQ